MSFVSIEFAIFFIILLTLSLLIKKNKFRLILLTIANIIFYAIGGGLYALIILVCEIFYFYGIGLLNQKHKSKLLLAISIIISLLPLMFFKYLAYYFKQFGISTFSNVFAQVGVPLGISFYILQGIAYLAEIYKGNLKANKNIFKVSIFLSLFSVVTSGPFESPQSIFDQLNSDYEPNMKDVGDGLKTMVIGLFLKLFIAESLGSIVDSYFNNPSQAYSSIWLLISLIFFAFQLYSDFYGYSLIAKGSAKSIGIDVVDNFHQPYLSSSITSFWNRWHMSFQKWLIRYIYIPLGGSRRKLPRVLVNILIVFLVSGIWHGTGLTFIIWGALNAIYIIIERLTGLNKKEKTGTARIIGTIYTFVFILVSWIFFRANSIQDALVIFKQIFVGIPVDFVNIIKGSISIKSFVPMKINFLIRFCFSIIGIACVILLDFYERKHGSIIQGINKMAVGWRITIFILITCVAVGFGVLGSTGEFMYAQF